MGVIDNKEALQRRARAGAGGKNNGTLKKGAHPRVREERREGLHLREQTNLLPLVREEVSTGRSPWKGEKAETVDPPPSSNGARAQGHGPSWTQPGVTHSPTSGCPDAVTCEQGQPRDMEKECSELIQILIASCLPTLQAARMKFGHRVPSIAPLQPSLL